MIDLKKYVKNNKATVLSMVAVAGVLGTTISAIKATPKAMQIIENEKQKMPGEDISKFKLFFKVAPCYIPTSLIAGGTVACILGANMLNQKQQATLMSAYISLSESFKDYRSKVNDIFGEGADDKVIDAVAIEKYVKENPMKNEDDEKRLYFDTYSGLYFEASDNELIHAMYTLNRKLSLHDTVSLNDFYDCVGMPRTETGKILGWNNCACWDQYNYCWLEYSARPMEMPDDLQTYAFSFVVEPMEEYEEY